MKVLVVAGSEAARQALCAPLLRGRLQVREASGGQEALERLGVEPADALVMDARGTALDGLNLLKRLRAGEGRPHVPVLLVFSPEDVAERLLALRLGAEDVLVPGWDGEELLARVQRSLALKQRVDQLVDAGRKLEVLSVTDGLTGVYNHRFFRERLEAELRRLQRYPDALALVIVDLDHFKDVNDLHGHLVGDQVLRAVAKAIRACLRDVDILARYGGEEFAVLLPQTHVAGALTAAERIRRDIHALRLPDEASSLRLSASLGVATVPNPAYATPDALVGAADAALYQAKREGRNRVQLAAPPPVAGIPALAQHP